MSSAPTYRTIRMPLDSPQLEAMISKWRDTKITALRVDPKSFFPKHDAEAALPASVWEGRFKFCTAIIACVAIADPTLSDEEALIQGEWVGTASIKGPMDYTSYYPSPDMEQPIPKDPSIEARWYIFDLYTLPTHRQRGLAKELLKGCVDAAVELSAPLYDQGVQKARIKLFVNPANTWVVEWYKMMGFSEAGKASLSDGFKANGWSESIPIGEAMTNKLKELWEVRFALAMDMVVELDR